MPQTRYQGSKRKLADWICERVTHLAFDSVLDAFSGTASLGHAFKRRGKQVTCNDILRFNHQVALALVENDAATLPPTVVQQVGQRDPRQSYPGFIERTFDGIYFTQPENRWLDTACRNIHAVRDPLRRAMAWFALGQAAMAKRPYNLFHRKNLYMRTANVQRSFGNKKTWDQPFATLFGRSVEQANSAVFDNGRPCRALRGDILAVEPGFDLVYIDPPYVNGRGIGVDYHAFYHFLEGMLDYESWPEQLDRRSRHLRLCRQANCWTRGSQNTQAFRRLFERFADSILVVSYRSDGLPAIADLETELARIKQHVRLHRDPRRTKYVLSTNSKAHEVLLVAWNDRDEA
jgi:adenine-specific DNA methylase